MIVLLAIFVWGLAALLFIPALVFFLEVIASFLPSPKHPSGAAPSSIAVIVPAHDESEHIKNTLGDIKAQLRDCDRLIVVADNCTDDTAIVAQSSGAEVIVRNDPDRRGKGYALQFAIDHLRAAPPQCVLFLDADCRIKPGGVFRLSEIAHTKNRPAQALYLMNAPEKFHPRTNVSVFAWTMLNRVRMRGLHRVANVTRFTGAGLAAPWALVSKLPFATGAITEDFVLTFKMADLGAAPMLVADTIVTSEFPAADKARVTQRARWEHGSLGVIIRYGLPALWQGINRGDPKLLALSLDAVIPPIILLGGALFFVSGVSWMLSGVIGAGPLVLMASAVFIYLASIFLGWAAYGRDILPLSRLWAFGPFVLEKLKIYGREGRASTKGWTRTDRDDGAP